MGGHYNFVGKLQFKINLGWMFSAFYCKSSAEAKAEEIQSTPQAQILLPGGVKGQGSESYGESSANAPSHSFSTFYVNGIVFVTFVPMKRCSERLNAHARYILQGVFIIKRENESRSWYFVITRRRVAAPVSQNTWSKYESCFGTGFAIWARLFLWITAPVECTSDRNRFSLVFFSSL